MANRSRDWLNQAVRDLEQAEDSRRAGRHEWACFAAHQAGEKAVKAVHLHLGQEAWGRVVARLLQELPPTVPEDLVEKGRVLDNFYIAPRYPNQPFMRRAASFDATGLPVPADVLVYTRDEWERP